MKVKRLGCLLVFIGCIWLAAGPGAGRCEAAGRVGAVAVTVRAAVETEAPPERISQRMAASVRTIADHVLIGKTIQDIEAGKKNYERLVQEVFDRILVGYTVEQVQLAAGEEAQVVIWVRPWGEVVRSVKVEMAYGTMTPDVAALVDADLPRLGNRIEEALLGLPVDAMDWAGGTAKALIREQMEEGLPEFRANIEVHSGVDTVVRIALVPAGAIIQQVGATVHSRTIPNFFLADARTAVEEAAQSLTGLPVRFVERHRAYFEKKIDAAASATPFLRRYGIRIQPVIYSGITTEVEVQANTDKYRFILEGYMDVGRKEENASARLHVGKRISARDEIYLETDFIPGTVTWKFSPGIGHRIGSRLTVGAKYALGQREGVLWLQYAAGERWGLRLERQAATGENEMAVKYRFREFLSAEYVITDKDRFIRLVANL